MNNKIKEFSKRLTILYFYNDMNKYIYNLFNEFFHDVVICKSEKEAKKEFKENHIDILIVDLDHRKTKKLNFIQEIKNHNESLITLTLGSTNDIDVLNKIIEIGVDSFILKPIDKKYFINVLLKAEKKYFRNEDYENLKQNFNLLKQYQDITDKSAIISKTDKFGKIIYANDNFCKVSEYTKNELLGKSHNIIRHPDNQPEIYKNMWNTIKNEKSEWTGIIKNVSKTGKSYYVKSMIKPILDIDGNIVEYIALRDNISSLMSDKKHLLNKIESNHLSFLILIQIEDFDMLEKFHNVSTVDKIEKMFGFNLLSYLPSEYIFESVYNLDNGRYALLTDFDTFAYSNINIINYLDLFVKNVKNSILNIDDIEYDVNILLSYSYGKYMLFEDAKSGLEETVNKKLDICYSNDFSIRDQIEAKKNLDVIKMVKTALEDYKIISYFQPIINNKTKQIEKYESLVRLIDERGKVLSPFFFLNISKKGNYYNKITHRVLENSFKMLEHINTKLSINLSALDIEKEDTRAKIFELLDYYKQDNHRLVFELLEDEHVNDFDSIKIFIKKVKLRGVQIAIDDFGAGYSNFERLLEFEPDILKIDGSLIKNIMTDRYSKNIVETIVDFAKKQNIKTIAEYVENEDIFNFLNELGVDYSQGYFFGKPEDLNLS